MALNCLSALIESSKGKATRARCMRAHAAQCAQSTISGKIARETVRDPRKEKWLWEHSRSLADDTGSELITIALLLALAFGGLNADLLVVLFESSKILARLRELALLHTLTDIPVDERTLGVHEVKFVIDAGEHLSDGRGVADHAHSAHHLRQVTTRHDGWWLVVDAALEASRAPIHELNRTLGLDSGDRGVHVLWDNISAVHEAAGHVLAVTWIALDIHGSWLEDGHGDLGDGELLVVGLLGRNDRRVAGKHEMDTRVWHEVSLELGNVNVEGAIETQGRGQRRNDLAQQAIQIGVGWALDVEVTAADVVQSLVIHHDGHVCVLEQRVHAQHRVVRLDDSGSDLWAGPDGETELGFLTVVDGQTLKHQAAETRSSATTDSVEDHEALQASAVVGEFSDAIKDKVHDLFANGVMTTGEVVRRILLTRDELLRVEKLAVGAGADFVDDRWLQVNHNAARHVLSRTSLGEESVKGIVATSDGLIAWHLTIRLNAVLKAEQLPARIANLDTSLANVDADRLTHCEEGSRGGASKM